ncbi:MAG: helix-turn-helix domain-containing protein, partial [Chloroflexota bacterium]|nr:helix-turn-helix domain-containing protein [Chloroflexota bacterium]
MTARPREDEHATSATFGEVLRSLRLRAGLSQEALAERAGLSGAAISALEQGARRAPYPNTQRALAVGLGLGPEDSAALVRAARRPSAATSSSGARIDRSHEPRLPRPLTRLLGREAELRQLQKLLDDARLVTLVGPGGIGKTRLALEIGWHATAAFSGDVCFADLSPIDAPTLIASTVAASVGVREQANASLPTTLSEALRHRRMLLVLDNCEHLIHACAALAQRLLADCPDLHILATSREPLRLVGEYVWPVPPLSQPGPSPAASADAVLRHAASQLFVERVQAAQPGFVLDEAGAPIVAEIVRRLDGIPLALELAATRVRTLGLAGLAARLDNRLRLLVGGHSAPARQQTLRATLDWSYELLEPLERELFARLAPFAGGLTLGDAEAVCAHAELTAEDVAAHLAALVDQSMVVVAHTSAGPRYSLLETMRQYAAERLNDLGLAEAAYRAHCDHYLAMAERVPSERYTVEHLDWLALEADNLRAALRWC